jgi:hypothetical protein
MVSGKTCSLGNILWKVLKQPIIQDLKYEDAAEYAIEYLRLIGASLAFEDKVTNPPLKLNNYKVALPNNLISIKGVQYSNDGCTLGVAMRYASNIYHTDIENSKNCNSYYQECTYITQSNILTSSIKEGWITISYMALVTDEFGYPLIPDNESFKVALEYYIIHRTLEGLWSMGKITDKVFQYYEQKRHYYSAQVTNSMIIKNMDQMETMMNAVNRMIIDINPQETFYKNFGVKEIIKQK